MVSMGTTRTVVVVVVMPTVEEEEEEAEKEEEEKGEESVASQKSRWSDRETGFAKDGACCDHANVISQFLVLPAVIISRNFLKSLPKECGNSK